MFQQCSTTILLTFPHYSTNILPLLHLCQIYISFHPIPPMFHCYSTIILPICLPTFHYSSSVVLPAHHLSICLPSTCLPFPWKHQHNLNTHAPTHKVEKSLFHFSFLLVSFSEPAVQIDIIHTGGFKCMCVCFFSQIYLHLVPKVGSL